MLCGDLDGKETRKRGYVYMGFQAALVVKNPSAKAGDIREVSPVPGSDRSHGGGWQPIFLPGESHAQDGP